MRGWGALHLVGRNGWRAVGLAGGGAMAAGASMLLAAPRSHCSSDAKNSKSWFVKPWTSFQAAASLPDKVSAFLL